MANGFLHAANAVFLVAMTGLAATFSSAGEPETLVTRATARTLVPLEIAAARAPKDENALRPLVDAYLHEGLAGEAIAVLDRAPETVERSQPMGDLAAASYLAVGRTRDAYAMNEKVLVGCQRDGCDATFVARSTRRAELLGALLDMGVEDAAADPDAVAVAYRRTSRPVRIAMN